jgi:apolipoprotein N-acyltransferase
VALVPLLVALASIGSGGRLSYPRASSAIPPGARQSGAPSVRLLRAFGVGWVAGIVYFWGTLYWITDVMVTFGGLSRIAGFLANAALVLFLALFVAVFAQVQALLLSRIGQWSLLLAPAVWVSAELGRRYLYSGFPWVLLGYSQVETLPIAQLASLFGVYGVSALVAFVSAALAYAAVTRGPSRWLPSAAAVILVAACGVWGSWRIGRGELLHSADSIQVGLVQGNVPQDEKWDTSRATTILERYLRMSREAAARGAKFIIWPESSTPFLFEQDTAGADAVRELARTTGAYVLIGSDQLDAANAGRYYNAAFLIRPDGSTGEVYRKIHLVPFGEYVPFKRLLFFAEPLVESVADFYPGDQMVTLTVGERRASTAICYEVVYPDLIRGFVLAGSELLTTITNDAWYGRSSAPHQHFEQAAMRAIEQGRYLARAANTGISGIVDPYGRVVARSEIFEPAVIVARVGYLDGFTLYGATGDIFAYACVLLTIGAWIAAESYGRRTAARGI